MFVFKAGVVGAGTMGGEIAHVIATAGIPVVLRDVAPDAVERGLQRSRSIWQAQVDAGTLDAAEADRRAALITGTTDYAGFADVDIVVEAVPERMEVKHEVFSELDEATPGSRHPGHQHQRAVGQRDRRSDPAPRQGGRSHFFFPASATGGRGHRGRRHLDETVTATTRSPRRSAGCRSAAPTRPGSSSTASSMRG